MSAKSTLVDDEGTVYRDFRRTLTPRWGRIWAELLGGYAVIFGVLGGLIVWDPGWPAAAGGVAAGAVVIGYAIAYVNNFLHEAAHYNLLPGRKANDVATNLLMSWLFGTSIGLYRRVHFIHHRSLGTTMDAENSYFDPLRVRYLVEGMTGLKVLRTLRRWRWAETSAAKKPAAPGRRWLWLGVAAATNGALLLTLALSGRWAAAIAWVAAELAIFPFFTSLRQTLEHRAEEADAQVDYREVDHGAVNRLFGDGPLASTFGSAGFNRHALHHWEPQVSYTRLKDVERYLMRTSLAPQVEDRQSTYQRTFLRLLEL